MSEQILTLKSNKRLTKDVYKLIFELEKNDFTCPGQFVNIKVDNLYLRRPISVCDLNGNELTLIVRVVGEGTRILCDSIVGAEYNMLTALGNGFDISKAPEKVLIAGGGVGCPPLYYLAKCLKKANKKVFAALGFNSKDEVFYEEEFAKICDEVEISTLDGSLGTKGYVTDALKKAPSDYEYVFACGPEAMLKAVYDLEKIKNGLFSFEERMGCGFGACMGCSCKTKYGYKRICTDGPVLCKEEIIW